MCVLRGSSPWPVLLTELYLLWVSWVCWLFSCSCASLETWNPLVPSVLLPSFELLLIWKYFHLFPHITCRCLSPPAQLGIRLLTYLFDLECVGFETIAQMLFSPRRVGDAQRTVLCGSEVTVKREVSYWEEIPSWSSRCVSRVDSLHDYLSCCNKLKKDI